MSTKFLSGSVKSYRRKEYAKVYKKISKNNFIDAFGVKYTFNEKDGFLHFRSFAKK